jgi:hypothetical protein
LFALLPPSHSDGIFHIKIAKAARAFDSTVCGAHAHTLPHNQTDRKHCRLDKETAHAALPGNRFFRSGIREFQEAAARL